MRGVDTYLAIKEQANLTTGRVLADLVAGDYLAFNSESLSGSRQTISNPAIRRQAMRSRAYSALGTVDASGGIEFTASNFVLNKLLGLIFHSKSGAADAADGSGATYTLTDGGVLTPFTAFVGFDGPEGEYTRQFIGAKVNTASFSARVNDMLRVNVNVAAIRKEILPTAANPVYPGGDVEFAFVYDQASVLLRSGAMAALIELPVETFDLSVNHNINTGAYRLGSAYRRSLQEGRTDVEGTFTVDASTRGVLGEALNLAGGANPHDPAFLEKIAAEARFASLQVKFVDKTRLVEDPDGTPNSGDEIYASLVIDLPYVRIEEPAFNVSDEGLISGGARFVAYDSISVKHISLFV